MSSIALSLPPIHFSLKLPVAITHTYLVMFIYVLNDFTFISIYDMYYSLFLLSLHNTFLYYAHRFHRMIAPIPSRKDIHSMINHERRLIRFRNQVGLLGHFRGHFLNVKKYHRASIVAASISDISPSLLFISPIHLYS